ncbi:hypothetical protein PHLGIDRAFT_111938 [Phlebiopsis gigantea 11061_1 CR5-6]|uniref:PEBP-like protein n=1 Tax=Phlebiopsis gigantea (strain 11061_1 CR5-6) TaxID=745531 RepID=A0A0C3S3R3_PHLG1|nr:hypothetical protein PHLGIDRAFT_111938 [Phlebiopsis gigantea 11061_1 CR5-6]
MRPIGVGVLPVYDRALEYIKQDSETLKRQLASVNTQLQKAAENTNVEEVEKLKKRAQILEVQSEINLPSVRWKARNGLADLSQPVYRHLVEQKWREDGALDLVMERVHQMNVVPDLLGELHPSFDLRVNFPERLSDEIRMRNRTKAKVEKMEPGVFLLPEQTRKPPALYTTVFHEEPRLYTMLMVDLDVPNPEHQGFQSYLHWMHPNITLHAFSQNPVPLTGTHTPYVPPHPQRGTPYHRYVLLLVPQASPTERIKIPAISMEQRLGFDYRAFAANHGLDASKGGGVFMWREVWDETVSRIHAETLKTEEPVFGRMPKEDLYAVFKTTKRYH